MDKPLVSVVIPCYNQGEYLKEAVDSVLSSTYENIEIIVVNDGSTKNVEFLKTFSAPKTKIIHQQNQGVALARNNGIKASNGKYILPLDADDKIYSTYIEKAVNVLENNEKIGIVYCEAEFFGQVAGKWRIAGYSFPEILWTNSIFNSAVYRKVDWQKVGGYKKEMDLGFEDWEFWLNLIESGTEVYKISEVLFLYRQTDLSRSGSLNKNNHAIVMFKQIIKFHPNLYADNLENILLPIHQMIEGYAQRRDLIRRVKYRINKILRKVLQKNSII